VRVVIVGGGILGLATGRLIAERMPDAAVTVVEKEREIATRQTATNSGVVHAGLYYEPGSLKARLCRRGVELLRPFCSEHDVPYVECGKLVVATDESELERLDRIERRATENAVPGLRRLDGAGLRAVEPHARGIAALHSPHTAITDFRSVATALAAEISVAGGAIRTGAAVARVLPFGAAFAVRLLDGTELVADRVVVCAGLQADRVARASGEPAEPRIVPFRGEYRQLRDDRRYLVRGLIYPVPDPALPFLGIHLTRRVDGAVLIGPNAVLALARESRRRSIDPRDAADTLAWPGTWRLMGRHWRAGARELARSAVPAAFVREARRYVPELRLSDTVSAPAGVRAQAVDRSGALVDDFRLGGGDGIVWVRNAPSPAATSSLAIAEEIVGRLGIS
jgi:L-2-hydroxyglutarate oxidase LhgO